MELIRDLSISLVFNNNQVIDPSVMQIFAD